MQASRNSLIIKSTCKNDQENSNFKNYINMLLKYISKQYLLFKTIKNICNRSKSNYYDYLCNEDIMMKCYDKLIPTNNQNKPIKGPLVYTGGEITEYYPKMNLNILKNSPCIIAIVPSVEKRAIIGRFLIQNGRGCYHGNSMVLTAFHVIEERYRDPSCRLLVLFSTGDATLFYTANIHVKSCNVAEELDLAYIQLDGDITPLGEGLQNQIKEPEENEPIYFQTLDTEGNFYKREGETKPSNLRSNKVAMSIIGENGESGSPVFNNKNKLIGIYEGISKDSKYGIISTIPPQFVPLKETSQNSNIN